MCNCFSHSVVTFVSNKNGHFTWFFCICSSKRISKLNILADKTKKFPHLFVVCPFLSFVKFVTTILAAPVADLYGPIGPFIPPPLPPFQLPSFVFPLPTFDVPQIFALPPPYTAPDYIYTWQTTLSHTPHHLHLYLYIYRYNMFQ